MAKRYDYVTRYGGDDHHNDPGTPCVIRYFTRVTDHDAGERESLSLAQLLRGLADYIEHEDVLVYALTGERDEDDDLTFSIALYESIINDTG